MKADALTGAHAGTRTVTFDPRTTILGRRVDAGVLQQPIARAGPFVLAMDQAGDRQNRGLRLASGIFGDMSTTRQRGDSRQPGHAFEHVAAGDAGVRCYRDAWRLFLRQFHV